MYIHEKVGDGGASGTGESAAGRMVARPKKVAQRGSMVRSSNLGGQPFFIVVYAKKTVWSNEVARPAEHKYK